VFKCNGCNHHDCFCGPNDQVMTRCSGLSFVVRIHRQRPVYDVTMCERTVWSPAELQNHQRRHMIGRATFFGAHMPTNFVANCNVDALPQKPQNVPLERYPLKLWT
jgi:hypothetical protein